MPLHQYESITTPKQLRQMTNEVLRACKTPKDGWDILLVGDGSGTTSTSRGGWGCVGIEHSRPLKVETFFGGTSYGSNIRCELLAYVFPLIYYAELANAGTRVHVVTDCKYVTQRGEQRTRYKKMQHKPLWTAVDSCRRAGLVIDWHWVPRDTYGLNKLAHKLANKSRKAMEQVQPPTEKKTVQRRRVTKRK